MDLTPLVIRTDSSEQIGSGHAMRCIALGEEWSSRGGHVVFTCHVVSELVRERLRGSNFELARVTSEPQATKRIVSELEASWIVLDLGDATAMYLDVLTDANTLVVDDLGRSFSPAPTLVLNQNAHASKADYEGVPRGSTLLGLEYLLLRDEFLTVEPVIWVPERCSDVLLALGGSDPMGLLPDLAEALSEVPGWTVHVVMPKSHTRSPELRSLRARTSRIRLHIDPDMAQLMSEMDLAITSGGTTVWELAYMGIPSVVGTVSPLEVRLSEGLDELGLFHTIGPLKEAVPVDTARVAVARCLDIEWRRITNRHARRIIDGHGRRRVVDAMLHRSDRGNVG